MEGITIAVAFLAGLVSFLSPCVLPIIPGFLSYLAGTSFEDESSRRRKTFLNSVFFVLGFGAVFAALGVLLNTLLEQVAYDAQIWLSRVGGAIIIFFGLYLMGLLKIRFLEREHKFAVRKRFKSKLTTSFAFGAAFAAGWTPCVGAALGAILGLAASQPGSAFYLLLGYSSGFAIPFLILGLFVPYASAVIARYGNTLRYINIVFGIVLVVLGILIFTQNLNRLANFDFLNQILLR